MRRGALHVELLVCLLAARRLLRRIGLEPALRRLTGGGGGSAPVAALDLVPIVGRVRRIIGRGTCLEESAALAAVLTRHRRRPVLVVGCRRADDAAWSAHAWIEVDGVRLDQAPSEQHSALATYRASSGWVGREVTAG
jgi:hypothetical protein